jgi:hypothetical protein
LGTGHGRLYGGSHLKAGNFFTTVDRGKEFACYASIEETNALSFILWILILIGQEAIARMKIGF